MNQITQDIKDAIKRHIDEGDLNVPEIAKKYNITRYWVDNIKYPGRKKKYAKIYWANHIDQMLAYKVKNKERIKKIKKEYNDKNKIKIRIWNKACKKTYRLKRKALTSINQNVILTL